MGIVMTGCSWEGAGLPGVAKPAQDTASVGEAASAETVTIPDHFGDRLVSDVELSSYIKLADYRSPSFSVSQITDEAVGQEIGRRLVAAAEELSGSQAQVQEKDIVKISFIGMVGYETIQDAGKESYILEVGSGEMVPGFEDALLGMRPGQTKRFSVSYPQDAKEALLAGSEVTYQVTLQTIRRPPVLSDEWARTQGYDSQEAYREAVRQELFEARSESSELLREAAFRAVCEESRVYGYPQADILLAQKEFSDILQAYAKTSKMTMQDFLASQDLSQVELQKEMLAYSQERVKENLILQAIFDQEGFSLGDEACQEELEGLLEAYGMSSRQDLEAAFSVQRVNEAIALNRAESFLMGVVY